MSIASKRKRLLDEISAAEKEDRKKGLENGAGGDSPIWNSSLCIVFRYILTIPFQVGLTGLFSWVATKVLMVFFLFVAGKTGFMLLLLLIPLYFFYGVIEYAILLLQMVFNFSGIKFSPNVKFGKITLLLIGVVYAIIALYDIWFLNHAELGIFSKILISYLYYHFVLRGIMAIVLSEQFFEALDESWGEIKEKLF